MANLSQSPLVEKGAVAATLVNNLVLSPSPAVRDVGVVFAHLHLRDLDGIGASSLPEGGNMVFSCTSLQENMHVSM